MNPLRLLSLPFRYKPWIPRHARLIAADLRGPARQPVQPEAKHVAAAIDWICRAQDVRDGCHDAGGVSAGWTFADGWLPSYPETSGYIVETLLAARSYLDRDDLVSQLRMAWRDGFTRS